MDIQRLSDEWLFERHSENQIRKWVNNLRYSYFKRAWGGHANDGDEFKLILSYKDKNDLFDILKRLDIKLKSIPLGHPKPISGKSYTQDEFSVFKSEINDFPDYEQPKQVNINGIKCYCWIDRGNISFTLSGGQDGDFYEVTETDFENCKKLEQLITKLGLTDKVSRVLEDSVTCISKKKYSELFE